MLQDSLYKKVLEKVDVSRSPVDIVLENGFSKFTRAYAFTNEGLEECMDVIAHKGKRILGIIGSGDHAISSMTQDCADYVALDISIFACFFAELKFAALRRLDYDAFKRFFGIPHKLRLFLNEDDLPQRIKCSSNGDSVFSEETYVQLRRDLSETARHFFDSVIGYHFLSSDSKQIPFALHYLVNAVTPAEMYHTSYLKTREAYTPAQEKIRKIPTPIFRPEDIRVFDASPNGKFDLIYLSNIPQHIPFPDSVNLIIRASTDLHTNGTIIVCGIQDIVDNLKVEGFKVSKIKSNYKPKRGIFQEAYLLSKYQ